MVIREFLWSFRFFWSVQLVSLSLSSVHGHRSLCLRVWRTTTTFEPRPFFFLTPSLSLPFFSTFYRFYLLLYLESGGRVSHSPLLSVPFLDGGEDSEPECGGAKVEVAFTMVRSQHDCPQNTIRYFSVQHLISLTSIFPVIIRLKHIYSLPILSYDFRGPPFALFFIIAGGKGKNASCHTSVKPCFDLPTWKSLLPQV